MADSNNHLAGKIPSEPYATLRQLDRFVGPWEASGPFLNGSIRFEWMDGGFFLIQHVDAQTPERAVKGVEYIGFDEETQTLRSHYMDIHGSNFTYTWEVDGDSVHIWFGDKGSDNFFQGRFADDDKSASGRWQWPGGGYEVTLTRV
ncbi:MAG: hypothetical protein ACXVH1_33685 [Solirubrobacteraceae bacterium]